MLMNDGIRTWSTAHTGVVGDIISMDHVELGYQLSLFLLYLHFYPLHCGSSPLCHAIGVHTGRWRGMNAAKGAKDEQSGNSV